ncbi:FAD binding domain-containing protein [Crepidotus variabilis]|uniref:FAD binding domain-containing protein n=1 Tax=Crepidotus variabilis TaxID=179855 RepID=A0A9P6E809_9AGAR|nr:FAD binding domain-containing protein [Crepidotus variabilis]
MRSLLHFLAFQLAFIALILGGTGALTANSSPTSNCRCLYGQNCWPNDAAFAILSQKLSQPLVHPTPVASPCYTSSTSSSCAAVQSRYADAIWRSDQPGAYEFQNFETYIQPNGTVDACYLNITLGYPCKQGSIPPLGVDARTPADVQAALSFATTYNLKLVVKNTGHDYQGRSAGRGEFMLWTHHMKNLVYSETFVPTGGPSNTTFKAITTGAGDQWGDVYQFSSQRGRMLVGPFALGGSLGTAGGVPQGGGISTFSPKYGLVTDNILQFTVVLANGSIVTANSIQNTDLFWALRGGGPSTFGIVLTVTYKTYPSFPVSIATFSAVLGTNDISQKVVTEAVKNIVRFTDKGWGGFMYIIKPTLFSGLWIAPNTSQSELAASLDPFGAFLYQTTGGQGGVYYNTSTSYYSWYDQTFLGTGGSQVTGNIKIASRLLSRELAQSNASGIAAKILSTSSVFTQFDMILGGAVNTIAASSVAANPSFRHSVASVVINEIWADGTNSSVIAQQIENLKKNTDLIDGISTDSGSYMNQGSLYERDFKKTFFGSNYPALRAIKQKYDPDSLLVVANGVGSDEWDKDVVCRTS